MDDCDSAIETALQNVHEQRSIFRNLYASTQYPVSGVLRCPAWSQSLPVEVLNYHFRGACLRVVDHEQAGLADRIGSQDITLDFFLGRQCVQESIPIRVSWNDIRTTGIIGIEFLANTRAFVERAERYLCHHDITPTIKAPDPLDTNRAIYCKVMNISRTGMLLSTSLTNKHLLPGMKLKHAELTVPGEQMVTISLNIQNIHKATQESSFYFGVTVEEAPRDYLHVASGYLSTMSRGFMAKAAWPSQSQDTIIRRRRVKEGLTFRVIDNKLDYRKVLNLRYQGYGAKGKLRQDATLDTQGEGLDLEGTIIGAYLAGNLVASMELRFGDSQPHFRTFDIIPREQLSIVDINNTIEANRLVIAPIAQGTDIFIGMIQKLHAVVMSQGGKDVLLLATDKLISLYHKIGCIELGVKTPHPTLQNQQLNAMMLTKEAFLNGRFLNPAMWTQLYEATNTYFNKITCTSHTTFKLPLALLS